MAWESVGLFLDGVVPVEGLLKGLQNAVADSLRAWQKEQSKSGQTGRQAQVLCVHVSKRVRGLTGVHACAGGGSRAARVAGYELA